MTTVACHAVALVHGVAEPLRTASVLVEGLGFGLRETVGEGSALVDNGAIAIRLVRSEGWERALGRPLELEVETDDLDGAMERLRGLVGLARVDLDRRDGVDRLVRRVELGAGVVVRLTKVLTEDDLGVLPPLPSGLEWEDEADRVVRRVLRSVPLVFRGAARNRATRRAEDLARERGRGTVELETAVQALVDVTPRFQHGTLFRSLADEGVAVDSRDEGAGDEGRGPERPRDAAFIETERTGEGT